VPARTEGSASGSVIVKIRGAAPRRCRGDRFVPAVDLLDAPSTVRTNSGSPITAIARRTAFHVKTTDAGHRRICRRSARRAQDQQDQER
jgi:hypothetical protein